MNFRVRRKLDMAGRVRDFCRTDPVQNPGHIAAVSRLDERLTRAEALARRARNQQHAGRAAHVGARAELEAVTSEIMLIVRQLDALNRFHFRKDAESLAAWRSARDVAWPMPPEKEVPPVGKAEKPAA